MRRGWAARNGALCLLALLGGGCLVTDRPKFGEPNVPASLRIVTPSSFTRVPPGSDPLCPNSSGPMDNVSLANQQMGFEVLVSDANIADKLETRLFVNGNNESEDDVPTTGEVQRGSKRICLRKGRLNNPCSHVELVVSRGFKGRGRYRVSDDSDLAIAEWWVLPAAENDPTANGEACALQIDGGIP